MKRRSSKLKNTSVFLLSRRDFLKTAGAAGIGLAFLSVGVEACKSPGNTEAAKGPNLPGSKIPQFIDPLPLLAVSGGPMEAIIAGTEEITLNMLEIRSNIMPSNFVPANGNPYTGTWVFGYRKGPTGAPNSAVGTYIGPVIVATRGQPTQIRFVNNLTANNIKWRDWIDQSLEWANPTIPPVPMMNGETNGNPAKYMGPVPAVPHLHGGEVPGALDGGPNAWYLSNESIPLPSGVTGWRQQGDAYYSKAGAASHEAIYRYPNTQLASPIWFHDHLMGATRINATFAGLAGAYAIIDPKLTLPAGLHPVGLQNTDNSNLRYSIPLVLQDRMFDENGQLYFPTAGDNPEHEFWVPEFVGDTIVVNGKVWPYLNVDRQRYRFYAINGSNSRPYEMFLEDQTTGVKGPRMWVIATDGGYLDAPVMIDPNATGQQTKSGVQKTLTMMPGERYEIIIDFNDPTWTAAIKSAYKGTVPNPVNLVLRNTAETVDGPPDAKTEGRLLQIRVSTNAPVDTSYNPASGTQILSGTQKVVRLVTPAAGTLATGVTVKKTRQLVLNEVEGDKGPLEVLVNNSSYDGTRSDGTPLPGATSVNGTYISEMLPEGDTEVWEIVNTTVDRHPIHTHAVQFQIMNRQSYDTKGFDKAYAAAFPDGELIDGYGPPHNYDPGSNPLSGGKYGGNPDIKPYLKSDMTPPLAAEAGWKDTVICPPGQVTRIVVRMTPQDIAAANQTGRFAFNPADPVANGTPGAYVWHCHITDHEDNEMMRPSQIVPDGNAVRTFKQGNDY